MPGGTAVFGPGRLQCDLCGRWFRPAGLHGHKRFTHDLLRKSLESEIHDLLSRGLVLGIVSGEMYGIFAGRLKDRDEWGLRALRDRIKEAITRGTW